MSVPDRMDERLRALGLVEAQRMAEALFATTAARGLVVPGRSEREASDRIGDLARELFGTAARLPGPLVRSGPHTLLPYGPETSDRVIGEDDVVVAELGSVLAVSEAGFASTLVFGQDPDKHRLALDLPRMFTACREALLADSRITGRGCTPSFRRSRPRRAGRWPDGTAVTWSGRTPRRASGTCGRTRTSARRTTGSCGGPSGEGGKPIGFWRSIWSTGGAASAARTNGCWTSSDGPPTARPAVGPRSAAGHVLGRVVSRPSGAGAPRCRRPSPRGSRRARHPRRPLGGRRRGARRRSGPAHRPR